MKGTNMKGVRQLTIVIKLGESLPSPFPLPPSSPFLLTSITGTSSIVDEVTHQPILSILSMIVETAIKLLQDGHKVIIVSSGAIGVGLRRMEIEKKPSHLPKVQVQTV
jgi:glutamate 5-kinase